MKTVFGKSAFRQLGRSLLIFLLIGTVTFSFASRIGEILLITHEMDTLAQYYRSIGNLSLLELDPEHGWSWIPDEVIDYLKQSRYVSYIDQRQYTSGVLQDGLYNATTSGLYTNNIKYGWAPEINPSDIFFYGIYVEEESSTVAHEGQYKFAVDEVLSGYPEYVTPKKSIYLFVDWKEFGDNYTQLKTGERYLLRAYFDRYSSRYPLGTFQDFIWKPLCADLPWFVPAESNVDLTMPEYARFASELKQSHDNACVLEVVATVDMSAIPLFQPGFIDTNGERYYLVDGRWLNYEDYIDNKRVIVIDQSLAKSRELTIGDSITVKLRDISVAESNGSHYTPLRGYQFNCFLSVMKILIIRKQKALKL